MEIPADLMPLFQAAASVNGVSPFVLAAICWHESRFDLKAINEESGAQGIAQFTEATWQEWGTGNFDDAFDPKLAILAQARYFAWLMHKMGGDVRLAIGAYYWGIGNVLHWQAEVSTELPGKILEYITAVDRTWLILLARSLFSLDAETSE